MVNKATASITGSRERDVKSPMLPLRFISEPAEFGTTHSLARLHLREKRAPTRPQASLQAQVPPSCALWPRASPAPLLQNRDNSALSPGSGRRDERLDAKGLLPGRRSGRGRHRRLHGSSDADGALALVSSLPVQAGVLVLGDASESTAATGTAVPSLRPKEPLLARLLPNSGTLEAGPRSLGAGARLTGHMTP